MSTKTIDIEITRIDNGFVAVGSDQESEGLFGQPLETSTLYFPDMDSLYAGLPAIIREAFALDHQINHGNTTRN